MLPSSLFASAAEELAMTKPTTWLLAGAALTLLAGAGVAFADEQTAQQQATQDAAAAPARLDRRVEQREVRVYRQDRDGDVNFVHGPEDRAENLSAILQLRPDQQPALKAFLEATRSSGHGGHMVKFDRSADERSTPERLDEMQAKMAAQQVEMSRKIAAIRAFYGQLDVKQKKAFDAMPMLMMVGPSMGPTLIPIGHPMPMTHRMPLPPTPPVPPVPPTPSPNSL